jgi:hypothetical protein
LDQYAKYFQLLRIYAELEYFRNEFLSQTTVIRVNSSDNFHLP